MVGGRVRVKDARDLQWCSYIQSMYYTYPFTVSALTTDASELTDMFPVPTILMIARDNDSDG